MFLKKKNTPNDYNYLIKIGALLVHAAKIDENYSTLEDEIIKKTLIELGAKNENVEKLIIDSM